MSDYINRIRKKALTDEELALAREQEKPTPADTAEQEKRLQALMDEAIPQIKDTESFESNFELLKNVYEPRGISVIGKAESPAVFEFNLMTRDGTVTLRVTAPETQP
jgi:hypothetical protein